MLRNRGNVHQRLANGISQEDPNEWVAWNRQLTRVVGKGRTFDEAKEAAAAGGECSLILARLLPRGPATSGRRVLYAVAVFVSPR